MNRERITVRLSTTQRKTLLTLASKLGHVGNESAAVRALCDRYESGKSETVGPAFQGTPTVSTPQP